MVSQPQKKYKFERFANKKCLFFSADSKTDSSSSPSNSNHNSSSEVEELKKNTQIYLKRFKKEKRFRRKLQEQLELETKRRVQMEEALRVTSAETLKRITDSMQKELSHLSQAENFPNPCRINGIFSRQDDRHE